MSVQSAQYPSFVGGHHETLFVPLKTTEEKEYVRKELTSFLMDHFQKVDDLKEKLADTREKIAENDRKIEQAQIKKAEGQRMQIEGFTRIFHKIFHGKNAAITPEQITSLFSTYLADGAISLEESKHCFKLNSMKCIVDYLKDHSDVRQCDFRSFKTEINDIPVLAEYLIQSTIKAIAINSGISQEAKNSLAEAVNARKGTLKVQYFA